MGNPPPLLTTGNITGSILEDTMVNDPNLGKPPLRSITVYLAGGPVECIYLGSTCLVRSTSKLAEDEDTITTGRYHVVSFPVKGPDGYSYRCTCRSFLITGKTDCYHITGASVAQAMCRQEFEDAYPQGMSI